ncbi:Lipase, GDSL [Corchorus olitorius]|uniref:Lipase, GDSL n=1 Tax=Corchorus olitorius TaxID=93759 RepID=A0A1R3HRC3_9ROSI|nr:Lipase, GDSL [Corchorus olitorius]
MDYYFSSLFSFVLSISIICNVAHGCFTSIFSFGDSLTDTGNSLQLSLSGSTNYFSHCDFPPYGTTFFQNPTGRCSDGRLVIDFIAEGLGLPYLPPYLEVKYKNEGTENLQKGVNFAVTGATAVDDDFFQERGIRNPSTNVSLGVELEFFKHVLPSLCSSFSDCKEMLQNSLIVMGEIGGNDYNYAFLQGKKVEEIREFVPLVVNTITSAVNELIKLGAVTFLIPGNFPIGCSPAYLSYFQGSNQEEYDPLTGFTKTLKACCGSGGPYNYNSSMECGDSSVKSCDDPSSYISWDGVHFTEATYRWVSKAVLQQLFTIPSIQSLCLPLAMNMKSIFSSWEYQ